MTARQHQLGLMIAIALAILLPATAGAQDEGWKIRAHGVWTDPDGSFSFVDVDGTRIQTSADSSAGLALSGEYRFSRRAALELGLLAGGGSDFGIRITAPEGTITVMDSLGFTVVSAGLNFYFTTGDGPHFYLGPLLAQVSYANLTFRIPGESLRVDVGNDFGYGASLGLDLPLGQKGWFFTATAKYIDTVLDAQPTDGGSEEISFDPLMLGAGFGYRF